MIEQIGLATQMITIIPYLGRGPLGPVMGSPFDCLARVQPNITAGISGQILPTDATAMFFVPPGIIVRERSWVHWLDPQTLKTRSYTVTQVDAIMGRNALSHLEIYGK